MPNMCTVINDNAYFFHWMIVVVVRNGQVFKYSQKGNIPAYLGS